MSGPWVDGESTEHWAICQPGFSGIKQLTHCGRCGEVLPGGRHQPSQARDIFKPTMHFICAACWGDDAASTE
jgi:hypothetical protein